MGCELDRDRLWVVRWTERQAVGCELDRDRLWVVSWTESGCGL